MLTTVIFIVLALLVAIYIIYIIGIFISMLLHSLDKFGEDNRVIYNCMIFICILLVTYLFVTYIFSHPSWVKVVSIISKHNEISDFESYFSIFILHVVLTIPLTIIYCKVRTFRKRILNSLLFFLVVFWLYYSTPFNIVATYKKEVTNPQSHVQKTTIEIALDQKREAEQLRQSIIKQKAIPSNSGFLYKYKKIANYTRGAEPWSLPRHLACSQGYASGVYELSCKEAEYLCKKIQSWYEDDVNSGYIELLKEEKFQCECYGWFEHGNNTCEHGS